jgi:hypothetical protein
LNNVGVTLDPRYECIFDYESNTLLIKVAKKTLPLNFLPEGISSLTAILGNNGAGKSTLMRYILNAVLEGAPEDSVEGIIVYECDGRIYYYSSIEDVKIEKDENISVVATKKRSIIRSFYYSGHFNPIADYSNPTTVELGGLYNASEGFLLRGDFEKFSNASDKYLSFPISSYIASHEAQNNYRICRLMIDQRVRNLLSDYILPQYIHIAPNHGGQSHIKYHYALKEVKEHLGENINLPPITGHSKEQLINYFIHANLLNVIADNPVMAGKEEVLNLWCQAVDTKGNVLNQFKRFIKALHVDDEHVKPVLAQIYNVINLIVRYANYNEAYGSFFLNSKDNNVKNLIDKAFSSNVYLTSRFFDMYFSYSKDNTDMTLSSGEQEILELFSRIYDAVEILPHQIDNIDSPTLLLLDEAEIGFHPEWQRSFIKSLIEFVRVLADINKKQFQIVLTSHSPILLSDIPSCCCNFLKKEKNVGVVNLRGQISETFACNVFEQYRSSFFMENGLVGCFASDWLNNLYQKAKDGDSITRDEIDLIGDKRLKEYFESYWLKCTNDKNKRDYYLNKLKEIEERNHE